MYCTSSSHDFLMIMMWSLDDGVYMIVMKEVTFIDSHIGQYNQEGSGLIGSSNIKNYVLNWREKIVNLNHQSATSSVNIFTKELN